VHNFPIEPTFYKGSNPVQKEKKILFELGKMRGKEGGRKKKENASREREGNG